MAAPENKINLFLKLLSDDVQEGTVPAKVQRSASQVAPRRMHPTLLATQPNTSRCFAFGARDVGLLGENPGVLRPVSVWIRG